MYINLNILKTQIIPFSPQGSLGRSVGRSVCLLAAAQVVVVGAPPCRPSSMAGRPPAKPGADATKAPRRRCVTCCQFQFQPGGQAFRHRIIDINIWHTSYPQPYEASRMGSEFRHCIIDMAFDIPRTLSLMSLHASRSHEQQIGRIG